MDESFPTKRFKSNKMINRATSGSEATLHINEQIVEVKVSDKSTVDNSVNGFADATCQRNWTIICRICWILTRLWYSNDNCFTPIRRNVTRYPDIIKDI